MSRVDASLAEQRFEIGEIAIICNSPLPDFDGREVEIIGPLMEHTWTRIEDCREIAGLAYLCGVPWSAYPTWCLRPKYLRKKKLPQETSGLEALLWKPEKAHV